MLKIATLACTLLFALSVAACGGASMDEDAKAAANAKCEMTKLAAEGKPTKSAMNKMNDIRKNYIRGENSAAFGKLFEKYKADCK